MDYCRQLCILAYPHHTHICHHLTLQHRIPPPLLHKLCHTLCLPLPHPSMTSAGHARLPTSTPASDNLPLFPSSAAPSLPSSLSYPLSSFPSLNSLLPLELSQGPRFRRAIFDALLHWLSQIDQKCWNAQSLKENTAYNGSLNCVTFNKHTYNWRVGLLIDHYKKLSFRNQEDAVDGIKLINRCKKINF